MAAQVAWSIFNTFRERYMSVFQICDLLSRDQFVRVRCCDWTEVKQGQMEACPVSGWVWPGRGRWKLQDEVHNSWPFVPPRREKKLLVLSKLWPPVSWSVQEGISAHPRGQIKLGGALGTNNLLFVQTRTSSTMRVVLCCPLLLFSLVLLAAHSKIFFNFAFNPFFFLSNVHHPELLISIYFQQLIWLTWYVLFVEQLHNKSFS